VNHLAHFKVSHPDPHLVVGGFLGDFIKGRLRGEFPAPIERGIRLHRAVDAYADRHPVARRSIDRFAPEFRRYGPIMVDVIYDHFLAGYWQHYHDNEISRFCDSVFAILRDNQEILPFPAQSLAGRMMASRSIESYHHDEFVARSLSSISLRLKRDNPLQRGFDEFIAHRAELGRDFVVFFPDLMAFCERWQREN